MNIIGTIEEILPQRTISEKFTLREFAVKTDGQYPESILFQCVNDKVKLLENLSAGQEVEVHFNLCGRKVKDRYWNSLKVWKVEVLNYSGSKQGKSDPEVVDTPNDDARWKEGEANPSLPSAEPDDLPFVLLALVGTFLLGII